MQTSHFQHLAPGIRSLSSSELDGLSSLNRKPRIAQDGPLEVYYAPFESSGSLAESLLVTFDASYCAP